MILPSAPWYTTPRDMVSNRARYFSSLSCSASSACRCRALLFQTIQGEGEIADHFFQQFYQVGIEEILFAGIKHQGADAVALEAQGQGGRGEVDAPGSIQLQGTIFSSPGMSLLYTSRFSRMAVPVGPRPEGMSSMEMEM